MLMPVVPAHRKKSLSWSRPYATARCRLEGTVKVINWCALATAATSALGPVTHPI
jgi:hypothetical protein